MTKANKNAKTENDKTALKVEEPKGTDLTTPSWISEQFEEEQETFSFIVPVDNIACGVQFVDGKVTTISVGEDPMQVTKVLDGEDGKVKMLALSTILFKHFMEKDGSKFDKETGEGFINVVSEYYKIIKEPKKKAKGSSGRMYNPYIVSRLYPKAK